MQHREKEKKTKSENERQCERCSGCFDASRCFDLENWGELNFCKFVFVNSK